MDFLKTFDYKTFQGFTKKRRRLLNLFKNPYLRATVYFYSVNFLLS